MKATGIGQVDDFREEASTIKDEVESRVEDLVDTRTPKKGRHRALVCMNTLRSFAYGHMRGIFRSMQLLPKRSEGMPLVRAVLEVSTKTRSHFNAGQPSIPGLIYIYGAKDAAIILRESKDGDVIDIPQMQYIFFAPEELEDETHRNGWGCVNARNLTAKMTRRWVTGSPSDLSHKKHIVEHEMVQENKESDWGDW